MNDLIEELRESKRCPAQTFVVRRRWARPRQGDRTELGHLTPAEVTAARIEQLVRDLEQRLAASSVARYLSPMNELLDRAVQHGSIAANPWATLVSAQRPKPSEPRGRFQW